MRGGPSKEAANSAEIDGPLGPPLTPRAAPGSANLLQQNTCLNR